MLSLVIAIKQNLVAKSKWDIKAPYGMVAEFITFHNTANNADAEGEVSYMIGNNSKVSYHFAIDEFRVVQGIPLNRTAWHCGDGLGKGNMKSIGVEVCYSKSGGAKYKKAEALAIKFIAQLLHERKWGTDRVKQHNYWCGKNCPHLVRTEGRWTQVIKEIQKELDALKGNKSTDIIKAPVTTKNYLEKGDKGTAVKNLQTLLDKEGYNVGTIDGIFGAGTEKAVIQFQKDSGLAVDGIAGNSTMQVLEAVKPKGYLSKGDKGTAVKDLQTQLKTLGYNIAVDGIYGAGTVDDVKDFQSKNGLTADGIVGSGTNAKLKLKVAEKTKPVAKKETTPAGLPSNVYGTIKVLADNLNIRAKADFNSKVIKTVKKGESYRVYSVKNGLYNVGGEQYCTSNNTYVTFTKNPNYKK